MDIEKEVKMLMRNMGNDSPQKHRFFVGYLTQFKERVEMECAEIIAAEKRAGLREKENQIGQ